MKIKLKMVKNGINVRIELETIFKVLMVKKVGKYKKFLD